jgi:hypothetical protein
MAKVIAWSSWPKEVENTNFLPWKCVAIWANLSVKDTANSDFSKFSGIMRKKFSQRYTKSIELLYYVK